MTRPRRRWPRWAGIALVVLAAFWAGTALDGRGGPDSRASAPGAPAEEATVWTCSMHPQIQMPEPGSCPLCGMDLIPLVAAEDGPDGPRTLTLSAAARAIAQVATAPVERRPVQTTLRMVGKIEPDESRVREISAWVAGRIDGLAVDATGVRVRAGQKLFDLYSPDLYSAQQELIQALQAQAELERSGLESTRRSASRTVEAARERLRLWGVGADQIQALESRGTAREHVGIVSPIGGTVLHKSAQEGSYVKAGAHVYTVADLSVVWLKLDAYESDVAWISVGQDVEFTTDAYAGEKYHGTVSFIDPVVDPRSRTVKVRIEAKNPDGRLKPGMFARAVLHADVRDADGGPPIVVPRTAPLATGARAVVYVADAQEPGRYEGRDVVLGRRAGDYVVVREGLAVGEQVVTNGAFKIDSALQIVAKPSMMNPQGGAPPPGHEHGGDPAPATAATATGPIAGVPQEFRRQLDDIFTAYYAVGDALSGDDAAAARQAAPELRARVDHPDHTLLPPDGHAPWGDLQDRLRSSSEAVRSAEDLDAARTAFLDLSLALIETARRFGTSGQVPVLVFHCPMAIGGKGADWLQPREGTENPYYGSRMFACGSRTETLAAGAAAGSTPDGPTGP